MLLYVGRYTEVKRIPLLIEAYARARPGFSRPAPLVLVGGFPGEWEGEHPLDAIRRTGAQDVFLAGWHDHEELPDFLAASDVVVLPSVREQFGQVLVEGMACGAAGDRRRRLRPAEIVDHGETGWLVEPDDVASLGQRARRGRQPPRRAPPPRGQRRRRRARALRLAGAGRAGGRDLRRGRRRNIVARERGTERLNAASAQQSDSPGRLMAACATATVSPPFRALGWGFAYPHPSPAMPERPSGRSAFTTRATSTTPAASPWSRGSTACRRTRRSSARSSRSRTWSTAARRAPIRTRATAPESCSSCPTSSSAACSARSCRRRAPTASACASSRGTPSARRSSSSCSRRRSRAEGQRVVAWRDVPVDKDYVGITANFFAPVRQAARRGGVRRARRRPGRVRAQALRDPPRGRDRRRPGARDPELLEPHDRLQGDAHLPAAARLLPRPAGPAHEVRARARPLALLAPTRSRAGSSRTRTG